MEPTVTEDNAETSNETSSVIQVPMVKDTMSFDSRQAARLVDIERRAQTEIKRKKRKWERQVEKMRSVEPVRPMTQQKGCYVGLHNFLV